ncbi:hypothetical protein ACFQ1E_13070 [Sphingomonas canadensis]|uniref:Uncharacterized protein n=1 Tax=Sphingomonas canadensis TaxID=1219257 RepID=A0ABW3HD72_9SPHN
MKVKAIWSRRRYVVVQLVAPISPDFRFTPQSQVIETEDPILGWFTAGMAEIGQRRELGKLLLYH